jgi:hypothetical protein
MINDKVCLTLASGRDTRTALSLYPTQETH